MTNKIIGFVAVAALVVGGWALFTGGNAGPQGVPGKDGIGAVPGGDFFIPVTFQEKVILSPENFSTTTAGSAATLTQADLMRTSYYTVNLGAANSFTYTLPATNTLTSYITKTGDQDTVCFDNATTTASLDLIFAAGTGIDLQVATGTSVSERIGPADIGCITFVRKANTDMFANYLIWDDSD